MAGIIDILGQNYNLLVVSIGTGILCLASGVVGTFSYLRKRALIGDVISHAVLPGVTIAFMLTGVKDPLYFVLEFNVPQLFCYYVFKLAKVY